MTTMPKNKPDSDAANYFKELPFCKKPIKNQKLNV